MDETISRFHELNRLDDDGKVAFLFKIYNVNGNFVLSCEQASLANFCLKNRRDFWLPCSPISPHVQGGCGGSAKIFFSLVMKTKLVQNVNRMSERQKDMPKDRRTDRQTDRQTERQIVDKTTFQLSYQNKTCSEC